MLIVSQIWGCVAFSPICTEIKIVVILDYWSSPHVCASQVSTTHLGHTSCLSFLNMFSSFQNPQ